MSMLGITSIGSFLILLQFLPGTLCWGREGHYAICKIAEGLLTEEAKEAVKMLLPEYANGDLAAVCSWADEIRHSFRWHWTSPLHYVDTPDFNCNYNYCRDCHDFARRKDRCVAGAIYNYSAQLSAYQYPLSEHEYNLTEALLFLSHFMGDIHQMSTSSHASQLWRRDWPKVGSDWQQPSTASSFPTTPFISGV